MRSRRGEQETIIFSCGCDVSYDAFFYYCETIGVMKRKHYHCWSGYSGWPGSHCVPKKKKKQKINSVGVLGYVADEVVVDVVEVMVEVVVDEVVEVVVDEVVVAVVEVVVAVVVDEVVEAVVDEVVVVAVAAEAVIFANHTVLSVPLVSESDFPCWR